MSARRKRLLSRDEYADQDDEGAPGMGSSPEAEGDVVAMDREDKGVRLGSTSAASCCCCWLRYCPCLCKKIKRHATTKRFQGSRDLE